MRVAIPRALVPLLKPARYKGAYGGRGSAKSHTFAQMAVIANYTKSARGVCIREVQNSIKDSVKQLIEDKIASLGLGPFFEVTRDEIDLWPASLALGAALPSLPLYIGPDSAVLVDFEASYQETCRKLRLPA